MTGSPREAFARRTKVYTRREVRKIALAEQEAGGVDLQVMIAEAGLERPKQRAACEGSARPCPFVACRFHLFCDVTKAGGLRLNFPNQEPDELRETCALDVADRGGVTLEEVGAILNLTRERVRQLEAKALAKFQRLMHGLEGLPVTAQPLAATFRRKPPGRRCIGCGVRFEDGPPGMRRCGECRK